MKNQRKRVGRPLKEAKEIKLPFHGTLPAEVHDLISQSNLSYGYLTEYAARILLGDQNMKELTQIEKELSEIEPKYFELKARKATIEQRIKAVEEERKKQANIEKYMVSVFRHILEVQEKSGKTTMDMDYIERAYGITFNVNLVNSKFSEALKESREGLLPGYLIEKYRIEKTGTGEREKKAMLWVVDSNEVTQ